MLRATLKSVLARKGRLLLTSIAVVLGVGFMAGTLVLTDTATRSFDGLFGQAYESTAVVVQGTSAFSGGPEGPGGGGAEERSPVPEDVLDDVRGLSGVAAVDGDVSGLAQLVDPASGDVIQNGNAPTIGNSWNPAVTPFVLRTGTPPDAEGEVAIDAATATDHSLGVGDEVQVVTDAGVEPFRVVATLGFGEQDSLLGATLAAFDLETAQRLFDREGAYDHLYVVAREGVSPHDLRAEVAGVLPEGFEAVTGTDAAEQQADQVNEALGFVRTALLVFAFVAVFVGAFIIFNTFNILVTQRTREIGLLRSLGASRRQVLTSIVTESVVVGLLASLFGLGFGIVLAQVLRRLFDAFGLELAGTSSVIALRTVVASLAVGTLVTVVASLSPARRASRIAPVEALREGAAPPAALTRRVIVGAVLAAGGAALLAVGLFGDVPNALSVVGGGAAITFVGVASLSPLVARPLAAAFGRGFRGVVGKLGTENAKRNPRRTASTASALMVGLGLVAMVTVLASSLKASAARALEENLRSDVILSTSNFSPMSPSIARTLADAPEVGAVSPIRQGQVRAGRDVNFMAGVDPTSIGRVAHVPLRAGSLGGLEEPGTILLFSGFADPRGLHLGDDVAVTFARTGGQELRVVGIYTDNSLLGDMAISLDEYERQFTVQLDAVVLVVGAGGGPPPPRGGGGGAPPLPQRGGPRPGGVP